MKPGSEYPIPNTYGTDQYGAPGHTTDWAMTRDLADAGFEGETVEVPTGVLTHQIRSMVLRNALGQIVATWDERRWWIPDESHQAAHRVI
jgi:hypothetical protein